MDVDVVLNACLETYQKNELQKAKDAAKIRTMQQEVITKSMTSRLFGNNGIVICDITELTISQSRPMTPIYEIGSSLSVYSVPGRVDITGSFFVPLNTENLIYERDPAYEYYIESDQLYSEGSTSRVRILGVEIVESLMCTNNQTAYTYRARNFEHITMRRE
jgi:hypothetical protein